MGGANSESSFFFYCSLHFGDCLSTMHVYDCERHRNLECLVKIGLLCSWSQVSDLYKVSFLFSLNFLKIN